MERPGRLFHRELKAETHRSIESWKQEVMMATYTENLINQVISESDSSTWEDAVQEWEIEDCDEDKECKSSCICGKEELRYLYTIRNQNNGNELFPIGSRCIKKFERDDLNYTTSLYESLFKLLHAIKDKKRIELTTDYFSRKLLDYLYEQDAFKPSEYNGHNGYFDYQFMMDMFNRRLPLTERQRRKVNAIIYFSIKPFLERMLVSKHGRHVT